MKLKWIKIAFHDNCKKKKRFFIECQIFKLADKKKSQVSTVRSRERFINMIRIAYFILRDR